MQLQTFEVTYTDGAADRTTIWPGAEIKAGDEMCETGKGTPQTNPTRANYMTIYYSLRMGHGLNEPFDQWIRRVAFIKAVSDGEDTENPTD